MGSAALQTNIQHESRDGYTLSLSLSANAWFISATAIDY